MPRPVSDTVTVRRTWPSSGRRRGSGASTRPRSVNFTALPIRLVAICRTRAAVAAHGQAGEPVPVALERDSLLGRRRPASSPSRRRDLPPARKARPTSWRFPLSTRLRSSRSEISAICAFAEPKRTSTSSFCSLVELCGAQELRYPEDAVHRRAQLVADVRQELGLAAVGRLRGVERPLQPPGRAHGVARAHAADRRHDRERQPERQGDLPQDAGAGARRRPDDVADRFAGQSRPAARRLARRGAGAA